MAGINEKLKAALDSQKYFVIINYKVGDKLEHFWCTKDYLKEDLMPTIEHIKKDVFKKEFGITGIIEKAGQAHG